MKLRLLPVCFEGWAQFLATYSASLCVLTAGIFIGWQTFFIQKIIDGYCPIKMSMEQMSYMSVISPIGYLVVTPIIASLVDIVGRKWMILSIAVPQTAAWITVIYAKTSVSIYMSRVFVGIGENMLMYLLPVYIGEIAEPRIRGLLGSSLPVMLRFGMLLINILSPFISTHDSAIIFIFVPAVFLATFVWMPDTPYFHVMKDRPKAALKSLEFFRQKDDVKEELEQITTDLRRQLSEKGTYTDLFTDKTNLKALGVMLLARTIQQLSGMSTFIIYAQQLARASSTNFHPDLTVVACFAAMLITGLVASKLTDQFGRKTMITISSIGATTCIALISTFFYLELHMHCVQSLYWFPSLMLVLLNLSYGLGLACVPEIMLGEIFSSSIKAKAICVTIIYYGFLLAIVPKAFYTLAKYGGIDAAGFTLVSFGIVNIILGYFFIPETKNKTLEEIQQMLRKGF